MNIKFITRQFFKHRYEYALAKSAKAEGIELQILSGRFVRWMLINLGLLLLLCNNKNMFWKLSKVYSFENTDAGEAGQWIHNTFHYPGSKFIKHKH